jgi:branched-chain amino acid aminotransferase
VTEPGATTAEGVGDDGAFPVWIGGELRAADEAFVAVADHGLLLGDGVFETLVAVDGRPELWDRHLRRLRHGLGVLGIDPGLDDDALRAAVVAVASHRPGRARVRLTVTAGPGPLGPHRGPASTVVVMADELGPGPTSVRLVTVPWVRNERSPVAGVKTTSYAEGVALLAHARRNGADEVVLADTRGRVSEGATANLVVGTGGIGLTPGLGAGCLPGVVRDVLLEAAAVAEADLPVAVLATADELMITSSTRGVVPVSHLDGRPLPVVGGPVATRAAEAFGAAIAADRDG